LNSTSSKISRSGQNVTVVLVFRLAFPRVSLLVGLPRANVSVYA